MWPFKGKSKGEKIQEKKNAGDNTNGEIKPTKKDKKENLKKAEVKNGTDANHSLHNLSQQLDVAEEAQAQLSQDLQRMTREKLEIQNQLALVRGEQDQHQATVEQLTKEKWELSAANTDLQQRLQQTVTLAHMQAEGNQSRLQEEVGRMMFQLEEERKVTANLSRTLELEKRKVESLEQKAKCGSSKMSQSSRGERRRSSLLPEEVRECETRLSQSMEVYRQRCDNLGVSLEGVQSRLEEERYRGDLTTEVNKLRSLLTQEKKKMYTETTRLAETSQLFEQVYLDYVAVMEGIKTASHEKKMKSQQQAVLSNIAESNMRDNVDSMTARLMQAEQSLSQERKASQAMRERLEKAALDLEALPLLQAQVEVYQSDFNAERTARERIAGEKADLEEQLRKMGNDGVATKGGGTAGRRGGGGTNNANPTNNVGSGVVGRRRDGSIGGRGDQHHGEAADVGRRDFTAHNPTQNRQDHNIYNNGAQYDNIPRTVNTRPDPPAPDPVGAEPEAFTCPKCNKEFRNMTLLTRHVNDCLDRDF